MRSRSATSRIVPLLALLLVGCAGGSSHLAVHWSAAVEARLAPADLLRHVEALAAPAMEGRARKSAVTFAMSAFTGTMAPACAP